MSEGTCGMIPDDEGEVSQYSGIQCQRCGREGFHWEQTRAGWRLFDDSGNLHSCKKEGE